MDGDYIGHGTLRVEPHDEDWIVVEPWPVHYRGLSFTVPAGFKSDGASVPRGFWTLFPPTGRYFRAAVAHDYLCELRGRLPDGQQISSAETHLLFHALMVVDGTRLWRAALMYRAVAWFGPRWDVTPAAAG